MPPTFRHATPAAVLLFVAFTAHAKTASEIYEQTAWSTVVVGNVDDMGKIHALGSGVVLTDGNVVTNCHIIKGASSIRVRRGTTNTSPPCGIPTGSGMSVRSA